MTDTDNGKLVRLDFNATDKLLHKTTDFTVSEIVHPIDIAIDQTGSLNGNPSADHIWIADDFSHQLVDVKSDLTVNQRIKTYYVNGTQYTLKTPVKVQTQEYGGRLAFIDGDRNAFVVLTPPSLISYTSSEFSKSTSQLSSIGLDANNEWWVADLKMRVYHKFTSTGTYLNSYSASNTPAGQFDSPIAVTKAPYYKSGTTTYQSQYVYTSDKWRTTSGERVFFPGTAVRNLSFNQYAGGDFCKSGFNFILTNKSYVKGTLYRINLDQSLTSLATYDYGSLLAGSQVVYVDAFLMGAWQYYFILEVKPYYWDSYGMGGGGWSSYPIQFTSATPQFFGSQINPVPSSQKCFSSGSTGTWSVAPPCPAGSFSYQWYRNPQTGSESWNPVGGNATQVSFTVGSPSDFVVKCVITNTVPGGYTTSVYYRNCTPDPPPPPSCPFVFTWDGQRFRADNNILPQSEYPENAGKDVTDFYRLLKPLRAKNGKYVLQIREFEREISWLDNVRLFAVDHPAFSRVDVSDSGSVLQYVIPFRLLRARSKGNEVTSKLLAMDSSFTVVDQGDTTSLSLADSSNGISPNSIQSVSGGGEVGASSSSKYPLATKVSPGHTTEPNSIRSPMNIRTNPTLAFVPMTLSDISDWKIVWNKRIILDYLNFGRIVDFPFQKRELSLSAANHVLQHDVKDLLSRTDLVYTTLEPGQGIELKFDTLAPPPIGQRRDFIIMTTGRYVTIPDSALPHAGLVTDPPPLIPNKFALNSNFPNPFNPSTRIEFQLPTQGHVSLIVYNILGQEIARLIDTEMPSGIHSAIWKADEAASGLYFCRLTVDDVQGKLVFSESRKMILLK